MTAATVMNWERDQTDPAVGFGPAILEFLGYDPSKTTTTLSDRMRAYRRRNGLSIKAAAAGLGVDQASWGRWERTGQIPWERYRLIVDRFLDQDERDH